MFVFAISAPTLMQKRLFKFHFTANNNDSKTATSLSIEITLEKNPQ